ncbi:hypothetical protein ACJX0J_009966, partial [Zea mays]
KILLSEKELVLKIHKMNKTAGFVSSNCLHGTLPTKREHMYILRGADGTDPLWQMGPESSF